MDDTFTHDFYSYETAKAALAVGRKYVPGHHWYLTNEGKEGDCWTLCAVVKPPVETRPRPMKSFYASLTKEQREAVKNYRGPENHGSDEFIIKA